MTRAGRWIVRVGTIGAILLGRTGHAQTPQPPAAPIRIDAAVALALENYPAVRAAEAQVDATRAGVSLARTAYLPRTDLVWQENVATRNNVAGLLLPQNVVPSISGPVGTTSYDGQWGSAVGALFSWEPFDFGLRRANVGVAESLVTQAAAGLDATRLQVAVHAADAFLSALEADALVQAARANLDRLQVLATSVSTLVQNQLRPGADASRADAEVAAAHVQLLRAQLSASTARATLAQALGLGGQTVVPDAGTLLTLVPTPPTSTTSAESHPDARADAAAVAAARSRGDALARAYVPHVNLQSALFARGAAPASALGFSAAGFWPQTSNWAAGMNLTFALFDVPALRARRQIEAGDERAARARYDATLQALRADEIRADSALDIARQVVATLPVELQAAREAESRAQARYAAGLGPLTEVADAARLLAQAESDDALSRLGVWQALLAEAAAHGSMALFLDQVK